MLCQTCEVNAAQYRIVKYLGEEIVSEWFLCDADKNDFAANIVPEENSYYGLENLWS
jgi:hypothetical protein